jgi:hypothetical protein
MNDVKILNDPYQWTWTVCPVKSRTRTADRGRPLVGLVVPRRPTVYIKNLFELRKGDLNLQLADVEKFEYATFEEMVADGWVVD